MNLDERTNQIFLELINDPQVSSKALCEKFELSRGQLNYTLKKINDSLSLEKFDIIKRTKNGHFIIPNELLIYLKGGQDETRKKIRDYVFSSEERVYLIQLMLLSKEDYLSLDHFIEDLKISRNTVLRDLNQLRTDIEAYELTLEYTRKRGYFIDGDEWNKRNLLSDTLNSLSEIANGIDFIIEFTKIDTEIVEKFKKRLELVEQDLNVQFTDERITVLPLLIILIIRRVQKGRLISYNFKINYRELADTEEYLAADRVIWDIDGISENEKVYLTLLLLTTNLSRGDILSVKEINKMKDALKKTINNFEKISGIVLEDKEKLLDRLLVHMRPAYYRIKYHLNLQTKYYQENKDTNLFSLLYLLKEASGPLVEYFGKEIPDTELFFISLFIGSHIVESTDIVHPENQKKAVIVCPNGISIAILLKKTLSNLLPELNFVAAISAREFYQNNYDVDFVFSAVPLETKKKLFVINSFLDEQDKRQLRERVLRSTSMISQNNVTLEKIMTIINKHATIKDENSLYSELFELFTPKDNKILQKQKPHLVDLLKGETIQLFDKNIGWLNLLTELGKPLLAQGIITENYIKTLQEEMPTIPPYVILRNKIILPHTVPEAGANGVGVSLGLVKEGIPFEGKKIHTVVLLASNDKDEHVDLIFELMNLAGSEELVELEKAEDEKSVRNALLKFNKGYWR